eukprot:15451216-Alexandrium_andersonii.AAC.1
MKDTGRGRVQSVRRSRSTGLARRRLRSSRVRAPLGHRTQQHRLRIKNPKLRSNRRACRIDQAERKDRRPNPTVQIRVALEVRFDGKWLGRGARARLLGGAVREAIDGIKRWK